MLYHYCETDSLLYYVCCTYNVSRDDVHCTSYSVRHTVNNIRYTVQYKMYNVRRTMYIIRRTMYNIRRIMYDVQCTCTHDVLYNCIT